MIMSNTDKENVPSDEKKTTTIAQKQQQRGPPIQNEAGRLFSQPKSRESMIRIALIPRMTRSGKVFDNRRYSSMKNLTNLVIKEEEEEELSAELEEQVSIGDASSSRNENDEKWEQPQKGTEMEKQTGGSLQEENTDDGAGHDVNVVCAMAAIEERVLESNDVPEPAAFEEIRDDEHGGQKNDAEQSEVAAFEVVGHDENGAHKKDDDQVGELIEIGMAGDDKKERWGKRQQVEKGAGRGAQNKKRNNVNNKKRRRAKPLPTEQEVHHTLASPPKISCLKSNSALMNAASHSQQSSASQCSVKTVHWADEANKSKKLFEVKEFKEEQPRRRCTMFHKYL